MAKKSYPPTQTIYVTSCKNCPLFRVDDQIYCDDPISGQEIYPLSRKRIFDEKIPAPKRCPLRKGAMHIVLAE